MKKNPARCQAMGVCDSRDLLHGKGMNLIFSRDECGGDDGGFFFGRVGGDWVCLRLLGFGGLGDRWLEGIALFSFLLGN